jgi:hypothetical protein
MSNVYVKKKPERTREALTVRHDEGVHRATLFQYTMEAGIGLGVVHEWLCGDDFGRVIGDVSLRVLFIGAQALPKVDACLILGAR